MEARRRPVPITTRCGITLAWQMVAPNSPQWFNTEAALGIWHRRPRPGHFMSV